MLKLYEFFADFGRMGDLEGLFIELEENIQNSYGKTVMFGEVLGKHSEIDLELKPEHFRVKSDNQEFIKEAVKVLGYSISGFNPIDILENQEDDEDFEEVELEEYLQSWKVE